MTPQMQRIEEIWDTGDRLDWQQPGLPGGMDRLDRFVERTGASRVVRLTWLYNGQVVSCPYPARVLPDCSGVVMLDEWHFHGAPREGLEPYLQHLRVFNPDGSLRLRIYPPVVDEHSQAEDSWIECPRNYSEHGIPFGCPARDGYRDMVTEYDWQTGALLRWTRAPWLRY